MPSLSIVIATRNRPAELARCLDAVARAHPPQRPFEIVVVDNASAVATARVLAAEATRNRLPLRVTREDRPGLARARNAGVTQAKSEAVVFLDDDAVVEPAWLIEFQRALLAPRAPLVQGRIIPRFAGAKPRWVGPAFLPHFGACDQGPGDHPSLDPLRGAAFGVRREAFDRIGLFREDLGAGASGLGEDTEFGNRATAAGLPVWYAGRAVAIHVIPPRRVTRAALLRRAWLSGLCQPLFQTYPDPAGRMLLNLARLSAPRLLAGFLAPEPACQMTAWAAVAEHAGRVAAVLRQRRRHARPGAAQPSPPARGASQP